MIFPPGVGHLETLGVVRSSCYARPAAEARAGVEEELAVQIAGIHADSKRAYGVPRVHAALRRAGRPVNRKKVERIMRARGNAGISRRN